MRDHDETRVLITGAKGFIGRNLVHLARAGNWKNVEAVDIQDFDLLNLGDTKRAITLLQPEVIFHLASRFDESDLEMATIVFEAAVGLKKRPRVVVIGSAAEYGDVPESVGKVLETQPLRPISKYGQIKAAQTDLALKYFNRGLDVIVGRVFNILSADAPQNSAIGAFLKQIKSRSPKINVGNLETVRDFLSVEDVCGALVSLSLKGRSGEVYNICSGEPISMSELLRRLLNFASIKSEIVTNAVLFKSDEIKYSCGSREKIFKDAKWEPQDTLNETLKSLVE